MDAPDERRRFRVSARLLLGALVLGGGITALSLLFGAHSASAQEPTPSTPVLSSVTSAVSAVVTPLVPKPAVAVIAPAAKLVERVAGSAPVGAVVQPVARTVDSVIAATPIASLPGVGSAPVATVTAPVASGVDGALEQVGETISSALNPSTPVVPSPPGVSPAPPTIAEGGGGSGGAVPTVPTSAVPWLADSGVPVVGWAGSVGTHFFGERGFVDARQSSVATRLMTLDETLLLGPSTPSGQPFAPSNMAGGVSTGAVGSGPGAASGVLAITDGGLTPGGTGAGCEAVPSDDPLPLAPVAEHDTSPD